MTKRAVLILNPVARRGLTPEKVREALDTVQGWETAIEQTNAAGHATELAREAADGGVEAVLACGGDGTLNEVANGLAGSETAMGAIRGGTANVWAKEVKVSKDVSRAVELLTSGDRRRIDLGKAGDRHYLLMAGIGLDAAIVRDVSPRLKRWIGAGAYVMATLVGAARHRSTQSELIADGAVRSTPLHWLLLANTRNTAGLVDVTHMAKVDDGLLDFCLLTRGGLPRMVWLTLWALLKRHQNRPEVVYEKVGAVDIRTPGLPVQIDGEYVGETPMTFGVRPNSLTVIVPPGLDSPLFSG